uniref:Gland-specific protein G2D01 n=1 Tax=Heterodera glycines TaxID=51029 RepID=Q8ITJ2_HETGL|nr:gland-specific protein G2D01 [Heterodera glycines]
MSSSPSVSVLAIVAIVCLMCQCCFSAPHPCCPGSQKVVSLMSNYVGTFANSISKSSLCSDAQNVAEALKGQLIGCSNGGDRTLLADIEASLATHSADECALSLGFVRAMFAIAASASSHASNNSEWQTLSGQFGQKVTEIDSKCAEFGISIGKVPINGPKDVHVQNVPNSESVISMPGLAGSHTQ